MADAAWPPGALKRLRELAAEARRTSFYQMLLLVERLLPDAVGPGGDGPVGAERVRIRPSLELAHPATDIESVEVDEDDPRLRVTITFLGLYGTDSPMPIHYSEHLLAISDERAGERLRDYLDVFHHRVLSLLFRSWRKSRPVALLARQLDPLIDRVLSTVGYSQRLGFGGREPPRLAEARLNVLRPRTAEGLEAMLQLQLGYRCPVQQVQLRRVALPRDQRSRLGQSNCALGDSAVLGRRIKDRNKIRIEVAAEQFTKWQDLLPEGDERRRLDGAVGRYLRDPMDYEVEVSLPAGETPPLKLSDPTYRLGRTAWLGPRRTPAVRRWQRRRRRTSAHQRAAG